MLMEDKEFEKWQEVRKQGAVKYSIKTSLICYILVFCIYFFTNGYRHFAKIDIYLSHNLSIWPKLLLTSIITIIFLYLACLAFWRFNEKRYNDTMKNKNNNNNA